MEIIETYIFHQTLEMILTTLINPIIFQMRKAKHADHSHVEKTAEKIENAPSFEVIKEKGKEALKKFYQYCNYGEALTQEEYISALEIVIGVLYINTFGGRSLEWTSCTLEDVKDVLEGKTNTWFCKNFKTAKTYGMRCIAFDDSTIQMLRTYVEKVGICNDFFNEYFLNTLCFL